MTAHPPEAPSPSTTREDATASPLQLLADGPVRRIGVLRAGMLGEMMCALPTLRALCAHWPQAELVLIGLPWARHWASRQDCIHHFIEFPGWPGMPEQSLRPALLPHFLRRMQQERFDLLVQLHGSGEVLNPMVAACGARRTAGFAEPGGYSADPALHVPLPREGHEILRLLAVVDHLGIPRRGLHLDWPMRARDRATVGDLVPVGARLACLHPGAGLASRRWPARHFAAVGDRLAREGFRVAVMGTAEESALVAQVVSHMREPAIDLAGRTDLWSLGAVMEAAAVVVGNDGGISQVAAAIGTPSVVVSCGTDASRWAPMDRQRHLVLAQDLPCRPCAHETCPLQHHECAEAITPEQVAAMALRQAASRRAVHTRRADPPPHLMRQVLLQHAR